MKMVKQLSCLLLFAILLSFSKARSITQIEPHPLESFKIKANQTTARSCSYTVIIKTSCSSPSYTRDKISLDFGDSHGNEVYAKRLDDPRSRTFERCSTDTFHIQGPCTYDICYLYLLRVGSDGWKPESVKVYSPNLGGTFTFNYNIFLPSGVWYGFKHCNSKNNGQSNAHAI